MFCRLLTLIMLLPRLIKIIDLKENFSFRNQIDGNIEVKR